MEENNYGPLYKLFRKSIALDLHGTCDLLRSLE